MPLNSPWYKRRSEPQMAALVTRMMASLASVINGMGISSMHKLSLPRQVNTVMFVFGSRFVSEVSASGRSSVFFVSGSNGLNRFVHVPCQYEKMTRLTGFQ